MKRFLYAILSILLLPVLCIAGALLFLKVLIFGAAEPEAEVKPVAPIRDFKSTQPYTDRIDDLMKAFTRDCEI